MSKPTQKTSKSRTNSRRSQLGLTATKLAVCDSCKAPVKAHVACPSCGSYKGRKAVDTEKRLKRRVRRLKPIS